MKSTENNKELVLEIVKEGYRRLVFRQKVGNGSVLFLEESDLVDFSRPLSENEDFNVFFTMRAFWKSFLEYTSNEGLLKRQVWHEATNEWLTLQPVFIHPDIKHLVQASLAEATRELNSDDTVLIDGIRNWLRKLAEPSTKLDIALNTRKNLRHAV
ncbi:MAG: hypothetical protein H6603_03335 [Flavobacteriales bacterium]|nr:hypothetical protein [Flavobacteriales bacterium]MCB9203990.1 hypothetical protein [Flavobacteriales bacterium]